MGFDSRPSDAKRLDAEDDAHVENDSLSSCNVDHDMDGVTCATDCDDDDPAVFPGQMAFFTVARANGSFDYNCDGIEEKIDDTKGCDDNQGQCAGYAWGNDVPACGQTAPGGACTGAFPDCVYSLPDIEMACH